MTAEQFSTRYAALSMGDDDIGVRGAAQQDPDFTAESHRVRYVVKPAGRSGPFQVSAGLRYQPLMSVGAESSRLRRDGNPPAS